MRAAKLLSLLVASLLVAACSDDSGSSDDAGSGGGDVASDTSNDTPLTRDTGQPDVEPDTPSPDVAADTVSDAEPDSADVADVPDGPPPEIIIADGGTGLDRAFAAAPQGMGAGPAIVYPSDRTLLPRNISAPTFQWEGMDDRYEFVFRTAAREHRVYTSTWNWQPEEAVWDRWVAESDREPVELTVSRLTNAGIRETSEPITIQFSPTAVSGAVYYWAPSAGGIVRLPVGETSPVPFLTGTAFGCVGCHALSPDGSRLAYTRAPGIPNAGTLGVVSTDTSVTQVVAEGRHALFYPSFASDNVRLAATRGAEIVVLDTDTGEVTETLPRPEGTAANFAAWSPRGDTVAFSAGPSGMGEIGLGADNAGIAVVSRDGDGWGEPEWLVENGAAGGTPENLFYPVYSPDGRWLAFNRATSTVAVGGSPHGSDVWIVSAQGTTPIRLDAANGPIGTTNSWPKWAPTGADGTLWVAFTSSRPYGRLHEGNTQIWIAGITPGAAAPGNDPSWSAFWLPGQSLGDTNHVAYWTEFVKD